LYLKYKMLSWEPTCFWNLPIRVILSSYSILSLSALMTLFSHSWQTFGQKIDTIMGFTGFFVSILFPVSVLYLMIKNFRNFDTMNIKSRFGSLYEDLVTSNRWIIAFRFWFILRRLILALNVIFIKNITH
jgi:hypothetical protein